MPPAEAVTNAAGFIVWGPLLPKVGTGVRFHREVRKSHGQLHRGSLCAVQLWVRRRRPLPWPVQWLHVEPGGVASSFDWYSAGCPRLRAFPLLRVTGRDA